MHGHKIFGDIKEFAIEFKPYKIPQKFYLKIWLKTTCFGDFKKGGGLRYIVNSYLRLMSNVDGMYETKFVNMDDAAIVKDLLFDIAIPISQEAENLLVKRMNYFSWDVADFQITTVGFFVLKPPDNNNLKVLAIENSDGKAIISSYEINREYFFKIYKEFVEYLDVNDFYRSNKTILNQPE